MDMESFESRKKKLRIQKYLYTCGRGLTRKFHVVVVQNNCKKIYKKVCCTCNIRDLLSFCIAVLVAVDI